MLTEPLPNCAKYCVRLIDVTDVAGNVLQQDAQV